MIPSQTVKLKLSVMEVADGNDSALAAEITVAATMLSFVLKICRTLVQTGARIVLGLLKEMHTLYHMI